MRIQPGGPQRISTERLAVTDHDQPTLGASNRHIHSEDVTTSWCETQLLHTRKEEWTNVPARVSHKPKLPIIVTPDRREDDHIGFPALRGLIERTFK